MVPPTATGDPSSPGPGSSSYVPTEPSQYEFCNGTAERDRLEPVAVVGFSLKFPQEATSPEAFWNMLAEKRCAMTEYPKDRASLDAFYHPDGSRPDTFNARGGHYLREDLGVFDAPFFSIAPGEAVSMDPQHRVLLETAYRALENAGIPMENVVGSETGVYTGSFADDYKLMMLRDPEVIPKYAVSGGSLTMLAARLSWFFNLQGPCVNLDTACSSSMIALDIACQGLRNRESTMALVAGANSIFGLDSYISLSNMNFLSPDSRCYSFDHRSNGYARGEGFGVVVLKLVSDAIRDGDTIRAIIRSTGSNQDGRTPGITQPSGAAQEKLIRATYKKAGLDLSTTRFFEAHGTGTPVGDPTECSAIGSVFREHRSPKEPLYVGAVKSNIGHLEGASGVAGLIKTILALERGVIPPNTNFERLNPRIDADFLNLVFPLSSTPWPTAGLRRASVNSFGFGGTNSHVVLEDAYNFLRLRGLQANHCTVPEPPTLAELAQATGTSGTFNPPGEDSHHATFRPKVLVFSTADEAGIARQAKAYSRHFGDLRLDASSTDAYLDSLAYTLANRRSSFPWKSIAIADSLHKLQSLESLVSRPVRSSKKLGLVFVFTGQGAQFSGMGRELLTYPVFRNTLHRAEMCLHDLGCHWSLIDELLKEKTVSSINEPAFSQPLCTALQIALVELLRSYNVTPSAVVGHSSGEIAAAYCIGGLSLDSACKVAYFRGRAAATLIKSGPRRGAMLAVGLSEGQMNTYLDRVDDVTIGCINSPRSVTLSGNETQIDALKSILDGDHVFARKLQVDVAYHSVQMQQIADMYLASIRDLEPGEPFPGKPVMMSSVTVSQVPASELCQGEYWVKNMVSPVRFSDALTQLTSSVKNAKKKLGATRHNTVVPYDLLEIGPHSALRGPIKDILAAGPRGNEIIYHSVLTRNTSATNSFLEAAGRLYCGGYPVDLSAINGTGLKQAQKPTVLTNLPEYPFDHSQRYWYESRISKEYRLRKHPRLDLLGTPVSDWNLLEPRWRKFLRVSETPWVEDHKVNGSIVYPATGMLVMVVEAARQMAEPNRRITGYRIKEATLSKALTVPAGNEDVETQLYLRPSKIASEKVPTAFEFKICVYEDAQWFENCHGAIQVEYEEDETEVDRGTEEAQKQQYHNQAYEDAVKACDRAVERKRMYEFLEKDIKISYGPAFQALDELTCNDKGEATAEVAVFDWSAHYPDHPVQPHVIHPTTLDAAAQLIFVALTKGAESSIPTTIPTRIENLWLSSSGLSCTDAAGPLLVHTKAASRGLRGTDASVFALDKTSRQLVLSIGSLQTTNIATGNTDLPGNSEPSQLCYGFDWKPELELASPEQTLVYCGAEWPDESKEIKFYEELSLVLMAFMSKTLSGLRQMEIVDQKPHLQKFVAWMEWQVKRYHAGELPNSRPVWASLIQDPEYISYLTDRIEKTNMRGKFFVTLGRNLRQILEGKADPLNLMFSDGLADAFYREMFEVTACCAHIGKYLDALAHKNPALQILEVGAGTGGFTRQILAPLSANGLARFKQYDYTDISPSFFERSEESLKMHGERMKFRTLDIESDPGSQGFELGSYDVVVAGSVLHATADLDVTMQNVRKLLKPGGKLILFEITEPELPRAGFAFGLLAGWWLSTESYRESSPCISEKQWDHVLTKNGFSGTELVLRDYQDESCHEVSIIVSTAVEEEVSKIVSIPRVVVVIDSESCAQHEVAGRILDHPHLTGVPNREIKTIQEASAAPDIDETCYISLLELERPILQDLAAQPFTDLQKLLISARELLWVTGGGGASQSLPEYNMVTGLARCLRSERTQLRFVTLALENKEPGLQCHAEKIISVLRNTLSKPLDDCEPEYMERNGILHINRMVDAAQLNRGMHDMSKSQHFKMQEFGQAPPLTLSIATPGLLDTLQFVEDLEHTKSLAPNEVEIEISATDMNFMDVLTVLGQLNQTTVGGACAGVVSRVGDGVEDLRPGDRAAACILGCFKTYGRQTADLVTKIPDDMSFIEAAALPCTYVTAYHGLIEFARLQPGETVLIHSGSGGTGQSAIQIAQYIGAEVYVTVGSDEKKKLVMDSYGIPEDHVFYSRNTTFAKGIMRMTHGRGVDVVLNSLSGDGLVASWECIAPFGRFIEIGKKDIHGHSKLPMFQFAKNVSFHCLDLASMSVIRPGDFRRSLLAVMQLAADRKLLPAQPLHVYPVSQVEQAFRYMQSGRNTGKTVVEMKKSDLVPTLLDTRPTYQFDANATYLIAGGLGGLGRGMARWLASRGAKNLILLSRSGPRTDASSELLVELRAQGVHVEAPACDITSADALAASLKECSQVMPAIKGCIQGTMVLKDATFENMTYSSWLASTDPKVRGSWNLHSLLPRDLDFFILLSSICGVIGSPGQSNYAAGNTYQDALAHHRTSLGLKATALDLGWMAAEGYVAENDHIMRGIQNAGFLMPIGQREFYTLLEHCCDPSLPVQDLLDSQIVLGLETPASLRAKGIAEPYFMRRPTLRALRQLSLHAAQPSNGTGSESAADYGTLFAAASSLSEAGAIVTDGLVKKLAKALSLPPDAIDTGKPLHAYGVDSLLAVELRNWFAKEVGSEVAIFDIMGSATFGAVGGAVAAKSRFRNAAWTDA